MTRVDRLHGAYDTFYQHVRFFLRCSSNSLAEDGEVGTDIWRNPNDFKGKELILLNLHLDHSGSRLDFHVFIRILIFFPPRHIHGLERLFLFV